MSAPVENLEPTIYHRICQGSFLIAMPAVLTVAGGPVAVWSHGGYVVRIILAANLIPSAICGAGSLESLVRTICIAVKDLADSGSFKAIPADEEFCKEVRRMTGMCRAAVFPLNGWAVLVKLPVYDYYIYAIPAEALKKGINGTITVAGHINDFLKAIHFWDGVAHVCDWTVVPAGRVLINVASGAFRLISWALR